MLSKELEVALHRSLAYAAERQHEYASLEHLLAALTEDPEVTPLLRACGVNVDRLRREIRNYVDKELQFLDGKTGLVVEYSGHVKPTASFQRVLQRAAIHVQAAGYEEVTGANVLVAMFAERESHAIHFLEEHGLDRGTAVSFIVKSISKLPQSDKQTLTEPFSVTDIPIDRISPPTSNRSEMGVHSVFISYSHKDARWISRLEVHLRPVVVRCCHSLEFGQDRHFLKVFGAEARPVDARRCGA
jgi:ATP-dependent Clp protease ATP-binding subunit ClpA